MTNYYFDMDGVLADFHGAYTSREQAFQYDFIYGLAPFMGNVMTAKRLMAQGDLVFISSLAASEEAKQAKIDWLAKYLPEIPVSRIVIIVGHGNKAQHMLTADGILIDDKASNCRQWEKAGHTAICLTVKGGEISL